MQSLLCKSGKTRLIALSAATLAVLAFSAGSALAISQSGEQKDMKLVGHVDLQGRGAYQPNFIKYPDGRIIAFAGLHPSPNLNGVPAGAVKNPLNGNVAEPNGTMIIDITNPKNPVQKFHIPGAWVPTCQPALQDTSICCAMFRAAASRGMRSGM